MASNAGIARAVLVADGGLVAPVRLGFNRPDVAAAFPNIANAGRSGMHAANPGGIADHDGSFRLHLRTGDGLHRSTALKCVRGEIQRVALDVPAAVPPDELDREVLPIDDREAALLEERLQASMSRRRGLTLRLDLVNKCNLRCVMCHYSDDRVFKRPARHITPGQFFEFFEDIAPDVREVVLSCGDEPLVSPHFQPIIRELARLHPDVEIVFSTNAMLLNERAARAIIESGVSLITFSIDGVTAGTLESIRTGARFNQVIGNMARLKRLRDAAGSARPLLVVNFVMMRSNIAEAPLMVEAARDLGLHYIDFRHVVPSEYFSDPHEMLENHPSLYNRFRESILLKARGNGVGIYLPPPLPEVGGEESMTISEPTLDELRAAIAAVEEPAEAVDAAPFPTPARSTAGTTAEEFSGLFCERPFTELMIRNQDEILPCPWHRNVLGNLGDGKSLREVFMGESFRRLRANMLRPGGDPGCAGCPVKSQHLPTDRM